MGLRTMYRRATGRAGLREAVGASPPAEDWFWGRAATGGTEEDHYWRTLSDTWTGKDVLPSTYREIHNQVYEAYNSNPLANAVVELGVNFVLGDGLQIDAEHPKVQKLIDRFWNDPDNHMNLRQFDIATELSLYGEIFIRFFVNPYDGHVKVAMVDPSLIDEIECDPENIERQVRCHMRVGSHESGVGRSGHSGTIAPNSQLPGQWLSVPDEVMHFAVNKVSNAKRGKSDLATLLPWLRRYKDWLIDRVRINKYKAAYLWDVTISGGSRQMIDTKMMEYARPPEPGSVLVHNESEQWKAVQPMIDAGSVAADGQAIKMMVAIGAGIPEHYLSEGGDVNRATAAEMSLPVLKKYQRRQDVIRHILTCLLDRAIAEARAAGTLPRSIDTGYTITFPDLKAENTRDVGTAAWHMTQGLHAATSMGIVSRETASKLFFTACRAEVDHNEEWERIAGEMTDDRR